MKKPCSKRSAAGAALLGLCAALIVACLLHGVFGTRMKQAARFESKGLPPVLTQPIARMDAGEIDANHADAKQLTLLPGIGEKLALEIVSERERNGPFYYPEDLLQVKGIGQKRLEEIMPLIRLCE